MILKTPSTHAISEEAVGAFRRKFKNLNRHRSQQFILTAITASIAMSCPSRGAATPDAYNLSGNGTFTGSFAPNTMTPGSGTSTPGSGDALYFGASTSGTTISDGLAAGFTFGGLTFNSNAVAFTISGNSFTLVGTLANSGKNLETLNNNIIFTSSQSVNTNTGGGNITLGGQISGSGSVNPGGNGTLNLTNAANIYTGNTGIGGSAIVNVATLANGMSNSSIGASSNSSSHLTFNGGTLQYTGSTAQSTDRLFTINSGGATLDASGTGNGTVSFTNAGLLSTGTGATLRNLTLTGTNTGTNLLASSLPDSATTAVSVQKSGVGKWVLSGASNYTGTTTINAGILNVQNATGLGTSAGGTTVANGASLQLQNSIAVGAEALTLSGVGATGQTGALINVSGTNSYGGAITLAADSTISSDSGALTLSNGITGAKNLTLAGAGGGTVSGTIDATVLSVAKTGAGTFALSGANTYGGTTTINNGRLLANSTSGNSATGTSTVTVASGGQLAGSGYLSGAVTLSSGSFLSAGGGAAAPATAGGTTADTVVGTLHTGTQSWNSSGTYRIKVAGGAGATAAQAGSTYDAQTITGALNLTNLSSTSTFNLTLLETAGNTFDTSMNATFQIASASSIAANTTDYNSLFTLDTSSLGISNTNNTTYFTVGTDSSGNDLDVFYNSNPVATPEPLTTALAGIGFTALAGRRRRLPGDQSVFAKLRRTLIRA